MNGFHGLIAVFLLGACFKVNGEIDVTLADCEPPVFKMISNTCPGTFEVTDDSGTVWKLEAAEDNCLGGINSDAGLEYGDPGENEEATEAEDLVDGTEYSYSATVSDFDLPAGWSGTFTYVCEEE
jgi:hypothetical protein